MSNKKFKGSAGEKKKIDSSGAEQSYGNEHPAFCFKNLISSHNLEKLDKSHHIEFIKKIRIWSQMTWSDIHQSPRDQQGTESIPYSQFKVSLPTFLKSINIIITRSSERGRVAGYRDGRIFHVVAISPLGDLYDH